MNKKNLRPGQCYYIPSRHGDNPKLGAKVLTDGRDSLFLDYYLGYEMVPRTDSGLLRPKKHKRRESLKLYLWHRPRTPRQRDDNRTILQLAANIRHDRALQLLDQEKGYCLHSRLAPVNFLDYFQQYLDDYTKRDKHTMRLALSRFRDFLAASPVYAHFADGLRPDQLTRDMVEHFTEYLRSRSVGEGAKTIYQRFKKVVRYALRHDVMQRDPCQGIVIKTDEGVIVKAFLSPDEERQLIDTTYPRQNMNVRRAFIFCLYTGMRFCDVSQLTYDCFDVPNRMLIYEQHKTAGHSLHSRVSLPLTDDILSLVGNIPRDHKEKLVFPLPSYRMCLKSLERWCRRAGIDKHITWHCARHSFGTNMATTAARQGLSIRVVQEMMGHSSLAYTQRYVRVTDESKRKAMQAFNDLVSGL